MAAKQLNENSVFFHYDHVPDEDRGYDPIDVEDVVRVRKETVITVEKKETVITVEKKDGSYARFSFSFNTPAADELLKSFRQILDEAKREKESKVAPGKVFVLKSPIYGMPAVRVANKCLCGRWRVAALDEPRAASTHAPDNFEDLIAYEITAEMVKEGGQ